MHYPTTIVVIHVSSENMHLLYVVRIVSVNDDGPNS